MVITREMTFDAAHRVVNHESKCRNLHGHTYKLQAAFRCAELEDIGYAVDFSEIKRVYFGWIDLVFDHGAILNPVDIPLIDAAKYINSKYWLMSLNGTSFCNPTAENIAKEIVAAFNIITQFGYPLLTLDTIRLWETPSCFVECDYISPGEKEMFIGEHYDQLESYLDASGVIEWNAQNPSSKG